jgi:hypothetical protein
MVFNACGDPSGNDTRDFTPTSFYVDSSGNATEMDSGRTVAVADDKAKVVFYSANLASSAQRVGFAYEGKTMIFLFENSKNFPTSMVLSDSGVSPDSGLSYKGTFTSYDSAAQIYGLTLEQGGDSATLSKIALSKDIFTQYKNNSGLTASQNLRMRNLYIAMCIYKSLDDYLVSSPVLQARGLWTGISKFIKIFYPDPVVDIVVGAIGLYVEGNSFISTSNPLTMIDNMSGMKEAATLLINGMNQAFGGGTTPGGTTFVAVTRIYDVPTTASIGTLALSGTVEPYNATNKNIVWSLKSSGSVEASIKGNTLTIVQGIMPTTVIVTATIANGGSGTVPSAETAIAGSDITLSSGSGLSKSGFAFGGWNTNSSGTGTNYNAGSSYTVNANVTLYAKWDNPLADPNTTLATKLAYIQRNAVSGGNYTVEIYSDEIIKPTKLYFNTTYTDVSITLRSIGSTQTISSSSPSADEYAPLLMLDSRSGSVTPILDNNITLQGNNYGTVYVFGGKSIMNDWVTITGGGLDGVEFKEVPLS